MSPALVFLAFLVSAHAAHGSIDICKPDTAVVKHDARILTKTAAQPKPVSVPHSSAASEYRISVRGSTINLSYNTTDRGNCALGHVESRWIDTSVTTCPSITVLTVVNACFCSMLGTRS